MKCRKSDIPKQLREASFTLFETIIALLIMSSMLIELTGLTGNTIYFGEYGSNMTRGIWLAKRVASQVEYYWQSRPFTEIKNESSSDIPFEDYPDFRYKLNITDFELPIFELLTGGIEQSGEDAQEVQGAQTQSGMGGMVDMIKSQVFGGEPIFKVANIEVSWAEGASRNSVGLTYLLTNQRKINEQLEAKKATFDEIVKASRPAGSPTPTPSVSPPPGGTQDSGLSSPDEEVEP